MLEVAAAKYAPYDASQIPVGDIVDVAGTPFDFTSPHLIGERIDADNDVLKYGKGYDHCWVLDPPKGAKSQWREDGRLRYAGDVFCPLNGRGVSVWTTEPCVQVYTANWASYDQTAKGGEHLSFRCGVALETQHAPDSPNKPKWPTTFLKPGETYRSATEFRFSAK